MTTREVEIETTTTEEVQICDGCGRECANTLVAEVVPEGCTEWVSGEGPEPLHFCSESCVDAVRATGGVREASKSSGAQTLRSAMERVWSVIGPPDVQDGVVLWWMMVMLMALSATFVVSLLVTP